MTNHPAKFSDTILNSLKVFIPDDALVLDPFAGVGKLKNILPNAVLNEIEYEWAKQGKPAKALVGNALKLPFDNNLFDVICTSCTYGNRMADHHNARDGSRRNTYTHTLGRPLHPDNSGAMQWGDEYRGFHILAWMECFRVLKQFGLFILNVSDHIRNGSVIPVSGWHKDFMLQILGYKLISENKVVTPRQKYGANSDLRVAYENIFVFRKTE